MQTPCPGTTVVSIGMRQVKAETNILKAHAIQLEPFELLPKGF
jgi:hypothetical protein